MARVWRIVLIASLALASCLDDHVRLHRGALGPAAYRVELSIRGRPSVSTRESAGLVVMPTSDGARLSLRVAGQDPLTASLKRMPNGQLSLDSVQGIAPSSAGEADLAQIVSQLDPPLPGRRVRMGSTWSNTRQINTEAVASTLTSHLRLARFRRIRDADAADITGTVSGRLRAALPTGVFSGTVKGQTEIAWNMRAGRLAESSTTLVWAIPDSGDIVVRIAVRPA
jgi:hypothetical protein